VLPKWGVSMKYYSNQSVDRSPGSYQYHHEKAFSFLVFKWAGLGFVITLIASILPTIVVDNAFAHWLASFFPTINRWAEATRETAVIRWLWIYMIYTWPIGLGWSIYQLNIFSRRALEPSKKQLFSLLMLILMQYYLFYPMFLFAEFYNGLPIHSEGMDDSFRGGIYVKFFFGAIFYSFGAGLSFVAIPLVVVDVFSNMIKFFVGNRFRRD